MKTLGSFVDKQLYLGCVQCAAGAWDIGALRERVGICYVLLELRKSEFICMTLIRKDIFLERVGICYVLLLHLIVFVLIVTGIQFLLKEYLTYEFLGWICVRDRLILEIITCHNHILTTNPYYFYPM